mmetsp:Transcript_13560/g.38543  ORF Transcript_13560/g.38543 Transcript_13560/m.38543 type:complete len:276 (-) Transcript_13560:966-1793(-)
MEAQGLLAPALHSEGAPMAPCKASRSWESLTGLVRKPSAPRSFTFCLFSFSPSAVTTRMYGRLLKSSGDLCTWARTSSPPMTGMCQSRSSTSRSFSTMASNASRPLPQICGSCTPISSSIFFDSFCITRLSSATRTFSLLMERFSFIRHLTAGSSTGSTRSIWMRVPSPALLVACREPPMNPTIFSTMVSPRPEEFSSGFCVGSPCSASLNGWNQVRISVSGIPRAVPLRATVRCTMWLAFGCLAALRPTPDPPAAWDGGLLSPASGLCSRPHAS